MKTALHRNIKTIYWMSFFDCAMIVTAVFVPLLQRHGLTMTQVLQTQALFALMVAACEVPSGYLADIWGRKKTIILGQILFAASFGWLIFADSFVDFLLYEAIIGVGLSLCSGADLALLYDSQTTLNDMDEQVAVNPGIHISRLVAIEGYAGAIAAVLASLLTLLSLDWVLWAQCAIAIMALTCSLGLTEAPRQISVGTHGDNFRKVLRGMYFRPVILWTSIAIMIFGLVGLYAFWLYQKYWELQGIPVVWFGYIWAVHCIIRGLSAHYAQEIEQLLGWREVFVISAILPLIGFFGMGLFGGLAGLLCGLAFPISRGANVVIFYDALNKRLDADFRATVNSLVSLGMRSVFIVTGPLLGVLVDSRGVQVSLLVLGVLFLPSALVVLLPLAKWIKREEARGETVPV